MRGLEIDHRTVHILQCKIANESLRATLKEQAALVHYLA